LPKKTVVVGGITKHVATEHNITHSMISMAILKMKWI